MFMRHQAERTWLKHAGYVSCTMLALLAKVQKAFIFGRLLQARVDNHSRNLGMKKWRPGRFFKTRGSLQTGPRYPPIIPGPRGQVHDHDANHQNDLAKKAIAVLNKLGNVFVSSRLTWTTVFLIQIHPVQVQWNKIIDHWGEFPLSTTIDREVRWRLL